MLTAIARKVVHRYRGARIALLGGRTAWRVIDRGLQMEIDPLDWMDQQFYLGTYDPCILQVIARMVRREDTCVDIGAQKGYVALLLAAQVGSRGRVYAFEPDPRARAAIKRNCGRNGLDHVEVFDYALGDRAGVCRFSLSRQIGWSSRFVNELARPTVMKEISVQVRSLDQLIESGEVPVALERLSLVKIDVEGSEPLVLRGMKHCLRRSQAVVLVEVNTASLRAAGFSPHDIVSPLTELGYALFAMRCVRRLGLPRVALIPFDHCAASPAAVFNLLAVKNGTFSAGHAFAVLRG